MIVRGRKGIAQQPVDALPGRRHLRTVETAREFTRAVEDFAAFDANAEFHSCKPKPLQARNQLRLGDNTGAAAGQFALDTLINGDIPAGAPQQQRAQKAAHRAANDNRALAARPGQWMLPRLLFVCLDLLYTTAPIGEIPEAITRAASCTILPP